MPKYEVKELKRPSQDPVGYHETRVMDLDRFINWSLAIYGGGYTSRQTANAMALRGLVEKHGVAHVRNFTITRIDD